MTDSLGFLLNRAARAMAGRLASGLESLGLTTSQWVVLQHVSAHPGNHQEVISSQLGMDAATLVGVLRRLEARGLVERAPDPADGRRRLVNSSGTIDLAAGASAAQAVIELALTDFSPEERELLRSFVSRIITNLEAS